MSASGEAHPILVTGVHRAGTTWVGRMLAGSRECVYIDEPFNRRNPTSWLASPPAVSYQYADDEWGPQVERMLGVRFPVARRLAEARHPRTIARCVREGLTSVTQRHRRPLVKDPFAFFSAPWLHKRFAMQPVIMVRHPAGFVASALRLGWAGRTQDLLAQESLMSDWLEPWRSDLENVDRTDRLARAALVWRCVYGTAERFAEQWAWVFVRYEDLAAGPLEGFRSIYDRVGLSFTPKVEAAVGAHSASDRSGRTHEVMRDSRAAAERWRGELTAEQVDRVRALTADVGWYRDDSWW